MRTIFHRTLIAAASSICGINAVNAEPQNGVIVAGTGVVNPEVGQNTVIDQSSDRLIIEWSSFDVSRNERVTFNQPGADAIALNRILSGAPSMIAGQINANGSVFLINADGVIFTDSANIDVNSLVVTSMDIANADFMADQFDFSTPGAATAVIINRGSISAADAGLVAFVAPNVENSGLIRADLGTVTLGSGEAFTLDFFGDGLVAFAASDAMGDKTGSIDVSGDIIAREGAVYLTATAARDFINTVINVESDLVADSATMIGGKIILTGGDNSAINIAGDLNASGRNGGEIAVSGGEVFVADAARLLANADQGQGDGGSINVSSTERTEFAGLADASPGASSGEGGDIFIGSDNLLIFSGLADAGDGARAGTITLSAGDTTDDGGMSGGDDSGNSGGDNMGGGQTGGGPVGGGPPIVILPPAVDDRAADAISEISATTPVAVRDPQSSGDGQTKSATVLFGDELAYDFSPDAAAADNTDDASLMCLHGVSNAACRGEN